MVNLLKRKISEEPICDVQFNIHKFSDRPRPNKKDIIIICCFSEFGCETVGAMYCVPRIIKDNPRYYIIVIGWYGRAYLYRHLADEFWELKENFQFLRDKAEAFHHKSKNLKKIEKEAEKFGWVVTSGQLGNMAVGNTCNICSHFWDGYDKKDPMCPNCSSKDMIKALFSDVKNWKKKVHPIPLPSPEKMVEAEKYISGRAVGVIARGRVTYGRNLQPEFYIKLIHKLESLGYTPIWLGEKQSTMASPLPHILDFSRMPESRDLELTLAIISKLEFTLQFWTASTRLSAIVNTPYMIFESPDQIVGRSQEGYRIGLTTTGKKKLVFCHYLNVYNDNDSAIELVDRCIKEMQADNWNYVIGMVNEPECVNEQIQQNLDRI